MCRLFSHSRGSQWVDFQRFLVRDKRAGHEGERGDGVGARGEETDASIPTLLRSLRITGLIELERPIGPARPSPPQPGPA